MYCLLLCVWAFFSLTLMNLAFETSVMAADLKVAMELNKKGEQLVEKAQYSEAISVFTRMQDSCVDHEYCRGVASFWLGRCYLEVSEYDRAMEFLNTSEAIFTSLDKTSENAKVLHVKGRVLGEKTDYDQALMYYNSAEKLLSRPESSDQGELFWLLANRAKVNIYLNNYDNALKDLGKAELLVHEKADPRRLGLLNEHKGLISAEQQHYVKALKFYEESLMYYESCGDLKGRAAVLNKIGLIHEARSQYPDALWNYEESLRIAEQLSDSSSQAFALNNMGMVYRKRGNYEKALEMYNRALSIRSQIGKDRFYSETLNNLGLVKYLSSSDNVDAFRNFKECYQVAKKVGSRYSEAAALHNMAWVLKDQGKFNQAREFSFRAVMLAEEIKHRRFAAQASLRLGNLYEYYGSFDEAIKQYDKAAQIQRDVGDRLFLSYTLSDIATIMTREGKFKLAEKNYREALKLKQEMDVPSAESLCRFALFYMEKDRYAQGDEPQKMDRKGDLQQADTYIKQAEKQAKPEAVDDMMLLTYVKGRYFLEKDPERAEQEYNSLKLLAESSDRLKYSFLALVGLGSAYEARGKLSQAEKAYESAVVVAEDIRKTLDFQARRTFLDGEEILGVKHVLPYEGLARVRVLKGDWARSLEAAEFAKARAFSDKLAQGIGGSSFGVDRKLLDELDQIESRIKSNYRRLQECRSSEGDRSSIPQLEAIRNELDAKLKEIERRLELDYPEFHAMRFSRPVSMAKSALRPDEFVLSYTVTDTGIIVYLIRGKVIVKSLFKPISRKELEDRVEKFREPLDNLKSYEQLAKFDLKAGKKLSDLLLAEVLTELEKGKPIIIVPDDYLAILPFEMLVLNDGGRIDTKPDIPRTVGVEFLGDRNPISYYQSLTALTLARSSSRNKSYSEKLLVIANPVVPADNQQGDQVESPKSEDGNMSSTRENQIDLEIEALASREPQFSGMGSEVNLLSGNTYLKLLDFGPLHETKRLAVSLKTIFAERADVFAGEQATMETFRKNIAPNIGDYGKVVFATHGYFGKKLVPEIQEPVLIFSLIPALADNLLRMSSVMNLDMKADVVTLLACQTGLGKQISGEGTMGMGRAFQYAGAQSVLMSLWSVDEKPSVWLVESFLRHLSEGKSKMESLKLARDEIRKDLYDHPFFWATFILVGEMERN